MERKTLIFRGRLILTNSSLSSIPTYVMGMYLLREEIHKQMDTIRSQFFWRGDSEKNNYHMVKWEHVCLPKDFGGLGIINTRLMNESLLLKWVWRILQNSKDDKCCQLLRAKYLKRKPFMQCREGVGSQFWKGINKIKYSISWGISYSVNNGRNTRFWEDVWALEVPLKLKWPHLYEKCLNKSCLVHDCLTDGEWNMKFRRSLNSEELQNWEELLRSLSVIHLNDADDKPCWNFEKSKHYSTKSMYRWLSHRGVVNKRMRKV